MIRASLYGVRSGIRDLMRMPVLVAVLAVVVGLATFVALLSPALDVAVEEGSIEIVAESEVIVFLTPDLDAEAVSQAERELGRLSGVASIRPATSGDIANTRRGHEVGSDIGNVRTLVLNGMRSQDWMVFASSKVSGVERADAGLGDRVGLVVPLLQTVVPWLTALLIVAGLVLVANVVFAAARSRREEAEIMRLVGASWLTTWVTLGTVVLMPIVATMILTTLAVAMMWPNILQLIAPRAIDEVTRSGVLGNGMQLTVVATIVSIGVSQLGLLAIRQKS